MNFTKKEHNMKLKEQNEALVRKNIELQEELDGTKQELQEVKEKEMWCENCEHGIDRGYTTYFGSYYGSPKVFKRYACELESPCTNFKRKVTNNERL